MIALKNVEHLEQADSLWSNRILGFKKTFQQAGCLVTDLSMLVNSYGVKHIPPELDDFLDQNGGYFHDSVVWKKIIDYHNQHTTNKRDHLSEFIDIRHENLFYPKIKSEIDNGYPLIGGIGYANNYRIDHYVLIIGYDEIIKEYFPFHDPGTREGNYYKNNDDNTIGKTDRHGGYKLRRVSYFI